MGRSQERNQNIQKNKLYCLDCKDLIGLLKPSAAIGFYQKPWPRALRATKLINSTFFSHVVRCTYIHFDHIQTCWAGRRLNVKQGPKAQLGL